MALFAKDDDLRSFDVPEIARHAGGYTIYKIILQITPKELTENTYQLIYWKRYSDIRKLYDILHRYHQAIYRPGKLPNFPEKSSYSERFNPFVIEERRVATKQFLNFALQHLYLRTHDAFINFFQKGEKVFLPDVQTDTLKPETVIPQQSETVIPQPSEISIPVQTISINEKKDDILLNINEQESVEHGSNTSNIILQDLNDLRFEETKDESNLNQNELEDLISLLPDANLNNSA